MTPLPARVVAGTLVAAAAFAIILNFVKRAGFPTSEDHLARPVGERNNDRLRCNL